MISSRSLGEGPMVEFGGDHRPLTCQTLVALKWHLVHKKMQMYQWPLFT